MSAITEQKIKSFISRAQKTGLDRELKFTRLLNLLNVHPQDKEVFNLIEEKLQEAEKEELINPNPFRATTPISYIFEGNIGLGLIPPYGIPYVIAPEMLTTHLLICGRTGGGKSNSIFLLLAQLLEMKKDD